MFYYKFSGFLKWICYFCNQGQALLINVIVKKAEGSSRATAGSISGSGECVQGSAEDAPPGPRVREAGHQWRQETPEAPACSPWESYPDRDIEQRVGVARDEKLIGMRFLLDFVRRGGSSHTIF